MYITLTSGVTYKTLHTTLEELVEDIDTANSVTGNGFIAAADRFGDMVFIRADKIEAVGIVASAN